MKAVEFTNRNVESLASENNKIFPFVDMKTEEFFFLKGWRVSAVFVFRRIVEPRSSSLKLWAAKLIGSFQRVDFLRETATWSASWCMPDLRDRKNLLCLQNLAFARIVYVSPGEDFRAFLSSARGKRVWTPIQVTMIEKSGIPEENLSAEKLSRSRCRHFPFFLHLEQMRRKMWKVQFSLKIFIKLTNKPNWGFIFIAKVI